jgi:hypothetical protein
MDVVQKYVPPARLPNTEISGSIPPAAFLRHPVA